METSFFEILTNLDNKYLQKDDNKTHVLYKLPRIRTELDDLALLEVSNPYSCYSFDESAKNWSNTTCTFLE